MSMQQEKSRQKGWRVSQMLTGILCLSVLVGNCAKAEDVAVTGITLDPTAIAMTVGEVKTIVAALEPENATIQTVAWESTNEAVATVDIEGNVTAEGEGAAFIIATALGIADGGDAVTATCAITVSAAPDFIPVIGIDISLDAAEMEVGGDDITLLVNFTPANATDQTITWSSSNDEVATVVNGTITAVAVGEATITASANGIPDGGEAVTAECVITVVAAEFIPVTAIAFNVEAADMDIGAELDLSVTFTPDNATDQTLAWSSSDEAVATVVDGKVTAIAEGEATITATANGIIDGGEAVTAECVITVLVPTFIPVTAIALNAETIEIVVGLETDLTVSFTPEDATDKTLTWSSSNDEVVSVVDGKITALALGEATITASANGIPDGGEAVTASCVVTVVEEIIIPVTAIELDVTEAELAVGADLELTVAFTPEDATDQTIAWTSSNEEVATVVDGVVTAIAEGEATITATALGIADGGDAVTAECAVTVVAAEFIPVTAIAFPEKNVSVNVGNELLLFVLFTPENATDQTLAWTSDNEEVATVDENGKVTALTAGLATITASANGIIDGGEAVTDTCEITVEEAPVVIPVTGLTLDFETIEVEVGVIFTLEATISPENATDKFLVWTSDNEDVATVDQDGAVAALAEGDATITVRAQGGENITASCAVTVVGIPVVIPVEGVALNHATLALNVGDQATLVETVIPENASNKKVTWSSDDVDIVAVENGVITALMVGSATITVTTDDGGFMAFCTVTVSDEEVIPVSGVEIFANASYYVEIDKTLQFYAEVTPEDATNKNVIWASSDEDVLTIDDNGLVTGVAEGTATVSATTVDGGFVATAIVKVVVEFIPVTGIALIPTTEVAVDGTVQLVATTIPSNATIQDFIWFSVNTGIASVSDDGLITGIADGSTTVVVIVDQDLDNDDDTIAATCAVVVGNGEIVPVTGMKLDRTSLTVGVDSEACIIVLLTPNKVTNPLITVDWAGDINGGDVDFDVDLNAFDYQTSVIRITGLEVGQGVLTVTTMDGSFTAECEITIVDDFVPVESLSMTPVSINLRVNETEQLITTITPDNASDQLIVYTAMAIPEGSELPIAVDANGLVTAIAPGEAWVIASLSNGIQVISVVVVISDDNEVAIREFITRLYEICLERAPDQEGLDAWTALMLDGSLSGRDMAYMIMGSQEFYNKMYRGLEFIQICYVALLNRIGEEEGVEAWYDHLDRGVLRTAPVADPNTNIMDGFAFSEEFSNFCKAYGIRPY